MPSHGMYTVRSSTRSPLMSLSPEAQAIHPAVHRIPVSLPLQCLRQLLGANTSCLLVFYHRFLNSMLSLGLAVLYSVLTPTTHQELVELVKPRYLESQTPSESLAG